ncbi:MAG: hypothetical protein LBM98_01305 [Oscillospiraceae bacterium]|jgi:hypothetical protein|nr:hypothetical protein [Oscillospiraceae bacterium]
MEVAERNVGIREMTPVPIGQQCCADLGIAPPLDAPNRADWVTAMLEALLKSPGREAIDAGKYGITEDEVLEFCVALFKPREEWRT